MVAAMLARDGRSVGVPAGVRKHAPAVSNAVACKDMWSCHSTCEARAQACCTRCIAAHATQGASMRAPCRRFAVTHKVDGDQTVYTAPLWRC